MTKAQAEALSERERNRKIAVLLGYKNPRMEKWCGSNELKAVYTHAAKQECHSGSTQLVPAYSQSRDACAEFESFLEPVEQVMLKRAYVSALMQLVGVSPDMDGRWSFVQDFALLSASEDNRSKAFLMAMIP